MNCESNAIDVMFMVDSSDGLELSEYNTLKSEIKKIINIIFNDGITRIAWLKLSNISNLFLPINNAFDQTQITTYIDLATKIGGDENMLALNHAFNIAINQFNTYSNAANGKKKIVIFSSLSLFFCFFFYVIQFFFVSHTTFDTWK